MQSAALGYVLQSLRAPAGPAQAAAGKPPVEFDQAISYVNKIKVRTGAWPYRQLPTAGTTCLCYTPTVLPSSYDLLI